MIGMPIQAVEATPRAQRVAEVLAPVKTPQEVVGDNMFMHSAMIEAAVDRLWGPTCPRNKGSLKYLDSINMDVNMWAESDNPFKAASSLHNFLALPLVCGEECGVLFIRIETLGECVALFSLKDCSVIRLLRVPCTTALEPLFKGTILIGSFVMNKKFMVVYLWDWIASEGFTAVGNEKVTFVEREAVMSRFLAVLGSMFDKHPLTFERLKTMPVPFTVAQYDALKLSSVPYVGLRFVRKNAFICQGMKQWLWEKMFFVTLVTWSKKWWCQHHSTVFSIVDVFNTIRVCDVPDALTIQDSCVQFIIDVDRKGSADTPSTFKLVPHAKLDERRIDSVHHIADIATRCQNRLPWSVLKQWVMSLRRV